MLLTVIDSCEGSMSCRHVVQQIDGAPTSFICASSPDDLYFRGSLPAFLSFRSTKLWARTVPQSWNLHPQTVYFVAVTPRLSINATPAVSPVIWPPKPKLLKWHLAVGSSCKRLQGSVGNRPLPIAVDSLTTTDILAAPQKRFSSCRSVAAERLHYRAAQDLTMTLPAHLAFDNPSTSGHY